MACEKKEEENLDADKMLAQSCGDEGVGVIKSTNEYDLAVISSFLEIRWEANGDGILQWYRNVYQPLLGE